MNAKRIGTTPPENADDDIIENTNTVAVISRLMQELSSALDPDDSASTSERLRRLVAGLSVEDRETFLKAVYGNPTSRSALDNLKRED